MSTTYHRIHGGPDHACVRLESIQCVYFDDNSKQPGFCIQWFDDAEVDEVCIADPGQARIEFDRICKALEALRSAHGSTDGA